MAENIGIELRQTHILYSQIHHNILKVNEFSLLECHALREGVEIIMKRQPNLWHMCVLKEPYQRRGATDEIQPEEETCVVCGDLQQSDLVMVAFGKAWTRLRVNAKNVL